MITEDTDLSEYNNVIKHTPRENDTLKKSLKMVKHQYCTCEIRTWLVMDYKFPSGQRTLILAIKTKPKQTGKSSAAIGSLIQ